METISNSLRFNTEKQKDKTAAILMIKKLSKKVIII